MDLSFSFCLDPFRDRLYDLEGGFGLKIFVYNPLGDWGSLEIDKDLKNPLEYLLKLYGAESEPPLISGNVNSFVAIFNGRDDIYVVSLELQDIQKFVIVHSFPLLLKFLDEVNSTIMSIGELEQNFGDED